MAHDELVDFSKETSPRVLRKKMTKQQQRVSKDQQYQHVTARYLRGVRESVQYNVSIVEL